VNNTFEISLKIRNLAAEIGFDACGFADAEALTADEIFLKNWLANGHNASMNYMENFFDKRISPKLLVEGTKSIIVVLLNYKPKEVVKNSVPQIAKYAYGIDYHYIIKQKLNQLLKKINENITHCSGIAFTDSAPVLERALAVKAGLGWIGKNSMLINRTFGSMVFIGELFVDIVLNYGNSVKSQCGKCENCLKFCPTQAIISPKIVDAHRCISYLTIENRGAIPQNFQQSIGNRLFGCDACIDACPYNQKTPPSQTAEFLLNEKLPNIDWQTITSSQFNKIFQNSALKRAGFKKIKNTLNYLQFK
jgi:epoxyqueuosine reductase